MASGPAWQLKTGVRYWRVAALKAANVFAHNLAAVQRLKKRVDFIACSRSPHFWRRPSFIIQFRPREKSSEETARLGFTVTKKQGNAVTRNRIKRRLREFSRLYLHPLLQDHADYVIIGRRHLASLPSEELQRELQEAVTRLHRKANTLPPK